jgi:alkaline phosphatase
MLIPDGCDEGVVGLARWYKGENLYVDDMYRASVLPYMANSFITDSAPAGTAYSTGQLTTDKFIAVGPRYDDLISSVRQEELWESYAPIPTILEAAKALGMSTGLVSTSRVTHATPASFAAHVDSRSKEQEIAKQMVFNNIDVVMGGGRKNMLPDSSCGLSGDNGDRYDCLNLEDELTARGYDLCFDKGGLEALSGDKAWCSFASSHMSPDIDRKWISPGQPSLPDMTKKAIELLSKNKDKGFFLMVEGSQVDWAGHSNDVICTSI